MLLPNVYIDGELWDYFVSRQGKVYSLNYRGTGEIKELKSYICVNTEKYKHPMVDLYKNGKRKRIIISRLVAQTYIPNPNSLPEVDHRDKNPLNNDIKNLRWVSKEENMKNRDAKNNKLSKAVRCIETNEVFLSLQEAERQKGYNNSNISQCCRGLRKTAHGFHWEYV